MLGFFTEEALTDISAELGVEAIPAFRFYKAGKEVGFHSRSGGRAMGTG